MIGSEERRERLQERLDAIKTLQDRRILGQFATPGPLATEIVEATCALVGEANQKIAFMDPAFGTGAFYSALLRSFPPGALSASGFEIDPHYGKPAVGLWETTGLRLELDDFTTQRPTGVNDLVDLMICNPPYVRHHHIKQDMKRRLATEVERNLRIRVSGLAGLYVYFMLISHQWIKPDAISAWLVPSEFMDVNYGSAVKDYLLRCVDLIRIHRFDPAEVQFGDAMVSSAVVWFRNRHPSAVAPEFTFGGSLASPRIRQRIDRGALGAERKWTMFPSTSDTPLPSDIAGGSVPTLSDLFAIKRGLVTGANSFFLLDEKKARTAGISPRFLRPVLPSPRHLRTDIIETDSKGVPEIDKRLFLFDCRMSCEELDRIAPKTAAYVRSGEAADVDKGYLASRRDPWYAQEQRKPAPFLVTYMGRSLNGRPPFRIILNNSKAVATNVYLMLYPKAPLQRATGNATERKSLWHNLRRTVEAEWSRSGRVYGGGLHKVEPGELGRLSAARLIDDHPELLGEAVRQGWLL